MYNNHRNLVLCEFLENCCSREGVFLFDLAIIVKALWQIFAVHDIFLREKMEDITTFEVKII